MLGETVDMPVKPDAEPADRYEDVNQLKVGEGLSKRTLASVAFITPSLAGSGRNIDRKNIRKRPVKPETIRDYTWPYRMQYELGIDRQLYMSTFFGSSGILPMGSISEHSAAELIHAIEADPIAVSLLEHGYSEIYPCLNKMFNFKDWIKNFYVSDDVLMGLEYDHPFVDYLPKIA